MSTRMGTFLHFSFRPSLVTALVKIAMIGSWKGRTFLDDDLVLDDVADFVPVETAPALALSSSADPGPGQEHAVAA